MDTRASAVGLIVAALLSGLLATPPARAEVAACGGGGGGRSGAAVATTFYTFSVDAKPMKKSYRIGEKMKIAMKVQRPGREDPLGEGNQIGSPHYLPAEGVEVSVALYAGQYHYRYGFGISDENGEAVISVPPFLRGAPAGPVRAAAAARAYYNRGGCPDIEEVGYNSYDPFFVAPK